MDSENPEAPALDPDPSFEPPRPPRPRLPTPAAAVVLFIAVLAANLLQVGLFSTLELATDWSLWTTPLLLLVMTAVAVALFRVDARETLLLRLPSASDFFMAVPLAISFVVLSDQLSSLTQEIFPIITEEIAESMLELLRAETALEWIVKLTTVGLLAAASEELLFRGFIQNGLLRGMSGTAAVLWTSFMFMLMHVLPLPSYAAAGIVLGVVALSTRSIVIPVVIHLVNNVSALALVNLTGLETLADPVWIPGTILIPALAIFFLTMGYFVRRLLPEDVLNPDAMAADERESPEPPPRRTPSIGEELSSVSAPRRRLGWLVVLVAGLVGASVLVALFLSGIYMANPRGFHESALEALESESANRIAPEAYDRAPDLENAYLALEAVNRAGALTLADVWEVTKIYARAGADGEIDSAEVDVMVSEIEEIVRSRTRPVTL